MNKIYLLFLFTFDLGVNASNDVVIDVLAIGAKDDFIFLDNVSVRGNILTKIGGPKFSQNDVGKRVVIPLAFDLTDWLPGGINNKGTKDINHIHPNIEARDAHTHKHGDFIEVTDPGSDPNVPWSGGKAHYLRVYDKWLLVKYRGNLYTNIISIIDNNTVTLSVATHFDVDFRDSEIKVGYGTDNSGIIKRTITKYRGQKLQLFFPNSGPKKAFYITPHGTGLKTSGNLRIHGNSSTIYFESNNIAEYWCFPPSGIKNLSVEGLIFKTWDDRIDANPIHANFNSSNLYGFRFGSSENLLFDNLEFHNFSRAVILKEKIKSDTARTRNVVLRDIKTFNTVLPIFVQQVEGLKTLNIDLDCAITGYGQHHIYVNNAVENWYGNNITLRNGQGYALQLQGVEGGPGNKTIRNIFLNNIDFKNVLYGLIIGGSVENVWISRVKGKMRRDLTTKEGLWLNLNGTAEDQKISGVFLSQWEISGGAWYDEVNSGNDYIEDVTLDNFTVRDLDRYGIKWRYSKHLSLINSNLFVNAKAKGNIVELLCNYPERHKVTIRNNYFEFNGGNGNKHGIRLTSSLKGELDISSNQFNQTATFLDKNRFLHLEGGQQGKGNISHNIFGSNQSSKKPKLVELKAESRNLSLSQNMFLNPSENIKK